MLNLIEEDESVWLIAQLATSHHAKGNIELAQSTYVSKQAFRLVVLSEVYLNEILVKSIPDFTYYIWFANLSGSFNNQNLVTARA